ncbi:MAG: RNA polymerase sigma factor [Muribaculaceae bacterium]
MTQNYEDIVRDWYMRLQPEFLRRLTLKFPALTLEDAENIYQDTFIAIYDNIADGRVRQDTNWRSYVMTIGSNIANHAMRKRGITDPIDFDRVDDDDENVNSRIAAKAQRIVATMPDDDKVSLAENIEVQSILGNELTHTPEPCASIIRYYYYDEMSMDEIALATGYRNAKTVKTIKSRCMTNLIKRVSDAIKNAGFDIQPKKRNSNGRN